MTQTATHTASLTNDAKPLRLAFLTVMPTPYMQDLFRAMRASGHFDLRVYYLELAVAGTYWGDVELPDYAELLPNRLGRLLGEQWHYYPGAFRRLLSGQPDLVVVGGYSGLTSQIVMRQLARRQIPWVFWGEIPGVSRRGRVGSALRRFAQRPIERGPSAIAAIGSRAAAAYRQLSHDRCPVANIPYSCDLQAFQNRSHQPSESGATRFLYCGQLIERKGVDLLLEAFCRVAQSHPRVRLTLVGTGPLRAQYEQSIPPQYRAQIEFAGFRPVSELPGLFANADVFVLPSRHDGWGVVVNQALGAGLAIVCSDAVGAAVDLVEPDRNGYIFPSGDIDALAAQLLKLAAADAPLASLQHHSRELAASWTPEVAAQRWWELGSQIVGRQEH